MKYINEMKQKTLKNLFLLNVVILDCSFENNMTKKSTALPDASPRFEMQRH
jgi:hypothetical protein